MSTKIEIVVDVQGLRQVDMRLKQIAGSSRGAESGINKLKAALLGLGAINVFERMIRSSAQLVDTYTNLRNKIRTVTASQKEAAAVYERLLSVSNKTFVSMEASVTMYQRTAAATKRMGVSQNSVIQVVENLNKAVALSGANHEEATKALIQFSQAMGSNRLSADEMRSVQEQLPIIADLIAEKFNKLGKRTDITRADLKALGEQGKITTKIMFEAMSDATKKLEEDFKKLRIPTMAQAWAYLNNKILDYVGKADEASGVSRTVASAIQLVADNVDNLARILTVAAITSLVVFGPAAVAKILTWGRAIAVALAAHPILVFIAAVTAAATALWEFRKQIQITSEEYVTLGDVFTVLFNRMSFGWQELKRIFDFSFGQTIKDMFKDVTGLELTWTNFFISLAMGFDAARDYGRYFFDILKHGAESWRLIFLSVTVDISNFFARLNNKIISGIESVYNWLAEKTGGTPVKMERFTEDANNVDKQLKEHLSTDPSLKRTTTGQDWTRQLFEEAGGAARTRIEQESENATRNHVNLDTPRGPDLSKPPVDKTRGKRQPLSFDELMKRLRGEGEAYRLNSKEREIATQKMAAEVKLRSWLLLQVKQHKRATAELTDGEKQQLDAVLRNNQSLKMRADILDQIRDPQAEFNDKMNTMRDLLVEMPQFTHELNEAMAESELQFLGGQGMSSTGLQNLIVFSENYKRQMRIMQLETRNGLAEIEVMFAQTFGPGGTVVKGLGDVTAQWIVMDQNFSKFKKNLGDLAANILASFVSQIIQVGINMALNAALGQSLAASATAASLGQAQALQAAWAGPAYLASVATLGSAALTGGVAVAGGLATSKAVALAGFASGGYTGSGDPRKVAGVVHGQEYVMNASATRRNRGALEAMNRGGSAQPIVKVYNNTPANVRTETINGELAVYIDQQIEAKAGRAVSAELTRSNSRVSKTMRQNFEAKRRNR
jgi:tape measure domain-containing protein